MWLFEYTELSEVWPLFTIRIPGKNQPFLKKIFGYKPTSKDYPEMLKMFGEKCISNKYILKFVNQ